MPRPLESFVRGLTALNRTLYAGASLLLLVIVPVMLFAVVARYGFGSPSSWGLELATLLFGPFFLLGGPYLLHTGGHVNLDLVRRAISPRANRALDLINYPVIALFAIVLLVYAWPFALQSVRLGETSYTSWNPAVWPVKLVIPVSLLLALQALAEWLRVLFGASHLAFDGPDDESPVTGAGEGGAKPAGPER